MKFQDHIALTVHTNRLQQASRAIASLSKTMEAPPHSFNFDGCTFEGKDAIAIKHAVLGELAAISADAQLNLEAGGITFHDDKASA